MDVIEDLKKKRQIKRDKMDEKDMSRGAWKPWLPKGRSFSQSNWIGDHDFVFHGAVHKDE